MKSYGSDQIELLACVLKDVASRCTATPSVLRDLMTIRSRVSHEGLSFITITLPAFGKDFERSLDLGQVDSTCFKSFKKHGAIPAFMQGMLSLVFDQDTGRRLRSVDYNAIAGVRQVAYLYKKLAIDCAPERVAAAIDSFETTELELSEACIGTSDSRDFTLVASYLWDCLRNINVADAFPKHGPGATAEGIVSNDKYTWRSWHDRLEPFFPLLGTAYPISSYGSEEFENVTIIKKEQELPVKVTPVPKTQKGPRIIAIEPVCMQYTQHALQKCLVDTIERSPLSAGHVNFTCQQVNRDLAMKSSIDGSMATLDLSDASDRVLHELAMSMFDCNPDLKDAVEACRSGSAKLPSGKVISPLFKFASMGSALCFPVESMYFYTICVVALLKEHQLPVTRRNVFLMSRNVYVYGDDIIVPRSSAVTVVGYLQKYYCKVNVSKSFWQGNFQESCGMDAYEGVDVTPVYVRHLHPTSRRQASALISWVSSMNAFWKKGYLDTSLYLRKIVERHLGKLPIVSERSSVLGCIHDAPLTTGRWNKDLHRSEVKGWSASPVRRTDVLHGYSALVKSLLSLAEVEDSNLPRAVDEKHLLESVRRNAVTLKRCWCPVS